MNPACLLPWNILRRWLLITCVIAPLSLAAQQNTTPSDNKETANKNSNEVVTLSEFVVTSSRDQGYRASNSIAGTRLNQKLEDVGQNITIVTEDFIKDTGATELYDAVRYVTGVAQDSFTNESSFTVRGFNALRPLRNGVTTSGELLTDTATIQRVEIVKGPSAVLYGVSSPGGVINYLTKEPDFEKAFLKMDIQAGSFGRFRPQVDYNQPLGKSVPVAIRLIAAYDRDTGYIGDGRMRNLIAPSISWRISKVTQLSLNYERIHQRVNRIGPGILTPDGRSYAAFPRLLNLMGPDTRISDVSFLNGNFSTRIGDHWSVKLSGNYHNNPQDFSTFTPSTKASLTGTRQYVTMTPNIRGTDYPNFEGQLEAVGRYNFLGIGSTTLVGTEYLYNKLDQWYYGAASKQNLKWYVDDPKTWTYGNFYDRSIYNVISTSNWLDRYQNFFGIYINQQFSFFRDRVKLTAGLRSDQFRLRFYYPYRTGSTQRMLLEENATSPKIGTVITVVKGVNLYGLISRSFNPNTQLDENGNPIRPQRGQGMEGGVKLDLMDGRFSMTGSVYQIKRNNIAQAIPGSSPQIFRAVGEETVKGAEAQIFYNPVSAWDIIASYSYNDGWVSQDAIKANIGNPLQALPSNTASFWNRYTIKSGVLKNLRFGLGLTYRGPMLPFPATTTKMTNPGYTLVDGLLSYNFKLKRTPIYLNLKVNNIFDKEYRGASGLVGMPINYNFSIGITF